MAHKCRQHGCPNVYDDIIGGDFAFGAHKRGAECLPCFFAAILLEYGLTPDRVCSAPELAGQILMFLEKTGWGWLDLEIAYERKPLVM